MDLTLSHECPECGAQCHCEDDDDCCHDCGIDGAGDEDDFDEDDEDLDDDAAGEFDDDRDAASITRERPSA